MSARAASSADPALPSAAKVLARATGEIFGGAVLHVRRSGEPVYEAAFGENMPHGEGMAIDSLFDLASITKLFAGTALLALFDRRDVSLDDPIIDRLPEFAGLDQRRSHVTFRHLLTHTSGLPAHVNFRDELGARAVIARVCATPLEAKPGTTVTYSDLGFMLIGEAIARIAGHSLEASLRTLVCAPIGAPHTMYRPPHQLADRIVCTEKDEWRKRLLRGEVHDENCWAMGGVAGHAGLFGTAADVATLAELYRNGGATSQGRVLLRPTAQEATREQAVGADERRGLAWALKASDHHSSGRRLSAQAFGHTGYTGTSVWVDPQRALTIVLLTNRVLYGREPEPIRSLRAAVHDAVVEDLT